MTWNQLIQLIQLIRLIAADKLGKNDIVTACRDLLQKSETDLEESALTQYLPAELHSYIDEAVSIRKRSP